MNASFIDNRNIVPRWRRAAETRQLHELDAIDGPPPTAPSASDLTHVDDAVARWKRRPTPSSARDVLSAALVAGTNASELAGAPESVHEDPTSSAAARSAAARLLHRPEPDPADGVAELAVHDELSKTRLRWRARQLKARIVRCPRNVVPWVDLAWVQLNLGQPEAAERAVRSAVAIAPDSRFALRSAARLLVHRRRGAEAHALLLRSERTSRDPWLLAAELGVADFAGIKPQGVRAARALLERGGVHPWHLAELAGALATLELRTGAHRRSRDLFRLALRHPNENVLAQAEWASEQDPRAVGLPVELNDERAFEAGALKAYAEGRFDAACQHAIAWQQDQPFDRDAAELASFCASTFLGEHRLAVRLAKLGLRSNPGDLGLVNNLAFALLRSDRTDEAERVLSSVGRRELNDIDRTPLLATRGMLAYRTGNVELGRALYDDAFRTARSLGFYTYIVFAVVCRAEEEIRVHTPEAGDYAILALRVIDAFGKQARVDPLIADRVAELERFVSTVAAQ